MLKKTTYLLNKTIPLCFIFFFTILFIFYVYKKFYQYDFDLNFFINLSIIFINIIFWFIVFKFKIKLSNIYILCYFSLILSLYFSEYILQKKSKLEQFEFFLSKNKNYDTRSKFEIYEYLKKKEIISPLYYPYNQLIKNRKIFINKGNNLEEIVVISGVSNRKTIVCNETGEYLIYMSDRFGFNNPDNLWDLKSEAITLGDSMTLGECVPAGNDITSNLRRKLNKNIINLGMGGNGPLFQLATMKEYHYITKAKKIIWIYYEGNDLLDLYNEKQNLILTNYLDSDFKQNLSNNQKQIDKKILEVIDDEYKNYKLNKNKSFLLLWKVRSNLQNLFNKKSKDYEGFSNNLKSKVPRIYQNLISEVSKNPYKDNLNYYKKILSSVKDYSNDYNLEIFFVYLPSVARFNGEFEDTDELFSKREIVKMVKNMNFTMIDTYDIFFKHQKNPLNYFPFEGKIRHFNSDGYQKISDIIEQYINN